MPVALELGVDLGALLVYLLAVLLAGAFYLIVKAIGSLLPNFSILGVGINLGHWFEGLAGHVESWIVDGTKDGWHLVENLFRATAFIFDRLFNAAVAAISHAFDYIDHLATSVIPDAAAAVLSAAKGYVNTVTGDMKTAITSAEQDLARDLSHAARAAYEAAAHADRTVENNVRAAVSHGVDTAISYTDGAIDQLHGELSRAIDDARQAVEGELADVKRTLTDSIGSLASTVAADYHAALTAAQADATDALHTAEGLIGDAKREVESIAQADANTVRTALQGAIDATNSTVTALTGTVATDLTDAERYAQGQVAAGLQDVVSTLTGTADVVTGAIGTAAAGVAGQIQDVITGAQHDADAALKAAEDAIAGALGGVYTDLTGKAAGVAGDLTSIEGLLAGAITGSIAGVLARVATLERCSVGVCDTSPNNFAKLLKDALGVAEFAGVGVFLAELINDPKRAEDKYSDVFAGMFNAGRSEFEQLLSL